MGCKRKSSATVGNGPREKVRRSKETWVFSHKIEILEAPNVLSIQLIQQRNVKNVYLS